jgi:hypothetical protein
MNRFNLLPHFLLDAGVRACTHVFTRQKPGKFHPNRFIAKFLGLWEKLWLSTRFLACAGWLFGCTINL